uniref:SnoaL-like domain-containing protein n=2 Tax=Plectus sambesii TaxID=2011161 RepID=A0A914WX04_9BILA
MSSVSSNELHNAMRAIGRSYQLMLNAFRMGDWDSFSDAFAVNCLVLPPDGIPIRGKDDVALMWKRLKDTGDIARIEIKSDEFVGGKELIVERGVYKLVDSQNKLAEQRRFMNVWRDVNGVQVLCTQMYQSTTRKA